MIQMDVSVLKELLEITKRKNSPIDTPISTGQHSRSHAKGHLHISMRSGERTRKL